VFSRLRPGDAGVKVGDGDTAAAHRVPDPAALAAVLDELLSLRR
jgi:trehalose 6-phosphate phosphatase